MTDPVGDLRARIAAIDRDLLDAVARRIELVEELRGVKEAHGLAFVDPEQERRVAAALVEANAGRLSEEGVRELVDAVLALTKRELDR